MINFTLLAEGFLIETFSDCTHPGLYLAFSYVSRLS